MLRRGLKRLGLPLPLPNPEWYKPTQSFWLDFTLEQKKARIAAGWKEYCSGWADEFAPPPDPDADKAFNQAVQENAAAASELYADAKGGSVAARHYLRRWMGVYRSTLEQFVIGYKEGAANSPAPSGVSNETARSADGGGGSDDIGPGRGNPSQRGAGGGGGGSHDSAV
mmetsp:Transcript_15697/g.40634  ORF Transcript_15697/g.40634 Transcript_15697/m.40634 type:complete len:169 (+) Transcript_15697:37-543(+)